MLVQRSSEFTIITHLLSNLVFIILLWGGRESERERGTGNEGGTESVRNG